MTVEVMDVSTTETKEKDTEEEVEKKDEVTVITEDIKEQIKLVERSVASKEPRFILRVLRALPATRRKLTNPLVLRKLITHYYARPENRNERELLISFLDEPMDAESSDGVPAEKPAAGEKGRGTARSQPALLLETDVYLHLLVLLTLLDAKKYPEALKCSELLMVKVCAKPRRSLDLLAARCVYYHSRTHELAGSLHSIRGLLHQRLSAAILRKDFEGQAVLINCLVRNYLHYNHYDQAHKLIAKIEFPQQANNNEVARFHYYTGRIAAVRLEYSNAHTQLQLALRKAPTQHAALGFTQAVQKLSVVVQLLLGEIPDRQVFRGAGLRMALAPYLQLTQAVRLGNLQRFQKVLDTHRAKFQDDHTLMLIVRLRHNVIKTGLRTVSLSYSKIPLEDVAAKLALDSREDAEFIVAKAIRDGVIEAVIDHEAGYMQSKETVDVYCTREPQGVYHQRIAFCLDIHNQSVKAMRYPPKSYNKDLESAEERREREQQDLELAKEMAEEEDDGYP
ncbi:probable 26S proteasome non-ATPase regulatory subunit 3 [Hyalella azteca]|uniref:Probable 26S proteasome non-ATPase regulatory subunit 3 n=1 Tax=Hyalella azteca TaxID=294128 RepID=A0A8B7NIE1_HYAAZ|nr:probable 26S proteasome non-ATPase regulatory subunit 3 [Hyalella azteca]